MDAPPMLHSSEGRSSQSPPSAANTPGKRAQGQASGAPRVRRRNRLITSCLECRRRKLKCDKSHPCSNCTKFTRDCVFLAPALDPSAQMRLAEIKEKMGSLERTLEKDVARRTSSPSKAAIGIPAIEDESSDEDEGVPADDVDLEPTPLTTHDSAYDAGADDDLLDLGIQLGKLRVTERIGGFVRPRLSEELGVVINRMPKPAIGYGPNRKSTASPFPPMSPEQYIGPGRDYVAPSSSFYFSPQQGRLDWLQRLPSKAAADNLMAHYWFAVHPYCRCLHRPSFERQYAQFWRDVYSGVEPPASFQAVFLAAMLSAIISMDPGDVESKFGMTMSEATENFREGTELALGRANFLRATKLETLQALVIYLIPLCRSEISRSHCALTGTAIRLAESLGLHRDGSLYGLPPVECQVRRMVWHQLCFLDVRTTESMGPKPQIRKEDYDTRLPLNVDDEALESPNPPTEDSDHFTDMTLTLVRLECNKLHNLIWFERPRIERKRTTLTALLSKVQKFWDYVEKKYLGLLDMSKPLHRLTFSVYRILTMRMHISILHRYATTGNAAMPPMPEKLRKLMLRAGVVQLEHAQLIETDESLKPWVWYSGVLQQYHVAVLLIVELYSAPVKHFEERIWHCLDYAFELPADMDRIEKSRFVISELQQRVDTYQRMKRVRAPNEMAGRLAAPPAPPAEAGAEARSQPTGPAGLLEQHVQNFPTGAPSVLKYGAPRYGVMMGAEFGFSGVESGEALFAAPPSLSPPNSLEAGGYGEASAYPQACAAKGVDEAMLDIDWNEWDKLFPQDVGTSDLAIPEMNFPSGFQ